MRHLKLMNEVEAKEIEEVMIKVNEVLRAIVVRLGLKLYDFKLEFGRRDGRLIVGDEITLDSMRVRDPNTGRIMDKDLYRKGYPLDQVKASYEEFLEKLRSVA